MTIPYTVTVSKDKPLSNSRLPSGRHRKLRQNAISKAAVSNAIT